MMEPKYGRTETPVRNLPAMELDFSMGKPLPAKLGRTDTPVRVLPPMVGEFKPVPALVRMTLWVRPDVTPGTVSVDLWAVCQKLDEFDREQNGAGLRPTDIRSEQTDEGEIIRLELSLLGTGLQARNERLLKALDGDFGSTGPWAGRSFVKWKAESTAA